MFTRRSRLKPERVREFTRLAQHLTAEREAATPLVERLLRETEPEKWPTLAEHPDLKTIGALERLANIFAETLTKNARKATAVAELAVSVAEGLTPGSYPIAAISQLQALAWKDLGKALRFLGRNLEAVDAFHTAESRLVPGLTHDRAIVRFNLAMSLQELGQFDESFDLITESRRLFDEHGDARNTLLCGLAEGILLQRLGRFREARETYLLLLASTKPIDQESLGALHRAIGLCSLDLRDFREAELNLRHSIALSREIGQPLEALKGETALGRLFNRKGEPQRAIEHLRPVRRAFLRAGLAEEAGICGLEIVEGLLLLDSASPAETLARKIVAEFVTAGLSARAIGALGYLAEAIASKKASTKLVSDVRDYIVSLRTSPERDFATS
jgi:tetratricopeptide (TPR) repeat protein